MSMSDEYDLVWPGEEAEEARWKREGGVDFDGMMWLTPRMQRIAARISKAGQKRLSPNDVGGTCEMEGIRKLGRCWNSWCDGILVCKLPSHPKATVRCNKCGSTRYLSNFKCKP